MIRRAWQGLCLLLLAAALWSACGDKDGGSAEPGACVDHGDCELGKGCIDSACVDVQCLSSSNCPLGSYCEEGVWSCVDGCQADTDCGAAQSCDTESSTCVDDGCRDTWLDCGYGEVCNEGTCETTSDPFCTPCTGEADTACGDTASCRYFDKQAVWYCLPDCDLRDEVDTCPYPAECQQKDPDVLFDGFCRTNCPELIEGGWL